jgi:hypothetical protein
MIRGHVGTAIVGINRSNTAVSLWLRILPDYLERALVDAFIAHSRSNVHGTLI